MSPDFKSSLHDEHTAIQRKTFTNWVNSQLTSNNFGKINDVVEDFSDGLQLINLVNCLSLKGTSGQQKHVHTPEKQPKNIFQKYSNINAALEKLKDDGLALVNIQSRLIQDQNEKICLGLVWSLICKYMTTEAQHFNESSLVDYINKILGDKLANFNLGPIKNLLDEPIKDGRVFKILNNHYAPNDRDKLSAYDANPSDKVKNFDEALNDANKFLGIPILLEGVDMDKFDTKSVSTQVLMYKEQEVLKTEAQLLIEKLKDKLEAVKESREEAARLNDNSNKLIKWIQDRSAVLENSNKDLKPEEVAKLLDFSHTHFKVDKPEKSQEFADIMSDFEKFKMNCHNREIPVPKTLQQAQLGSAWQEMCASEVLMLDFLNKITIKYKKADTLHRSFLVLADTLKQSIVNSKEIIQKAEDLVKDTSLSQIGNAEIAIEIAHNDIDRLNDLVADIESFVEENVTPLELNKDFENEKFNNGIKDIKEKMSDLPESINRIEKDLNDAKVKASQAKDMMKQAASLMKKISNKADRFEAFASQKDPYDSLEEFEASTVGFKSEQFQALLDDLEKVKDLYSQMADIMGINRNERDPLSIDNLYTFLKPIPLNNRLSQLVDKINEKLQFDANEHNRLKQEADMRENLKHGVDALNQEIEKYNLAVQNINKENEQHPNVMQSIGSLESVKKQVEAIEPAFEKVKTAAGKISGVQTDLFMLSSNLDSLLVKIKNYIDSLKSVTNSALSNEDASLSEEEIKEIEKAFNFAKNHDHLDLNGFVSVAMEVPIVGVHQVTANSPQLHSLFESHSTNKISMNLAQLKNLYINCKMEFITNSKDKVKTMLHNAAEEGGMISHEKLANLVGEDFVTRIVSDIKSEERNGETFYMVSDLL